MSCTKLPYRFGILLTMLPLVWVSVASAQTFRDNKELADETLRRQQEGQGSDLIRPLLKGMLDVESTTSASRVQIQKITIVGAASIAAARLAQVVEPYKDSAMGLAEMQELTDLLTEEYQRDGYFLSRAFVEPQSFENGELIVRISEGFVSAIEIEGNRDHTLRKYFDDLVLEKPARYTSYKAVLNIMRARLGLSLVSPKVSRDENADNGYVISFDIEPQKKRLRLDLVDKGVRDGEPLRALVNASVQSVFKMGDNVTLGYLTKPRAVRELSYLFGRYTAPIGSKGTLIFAEATHSDSKPESALPGRDLQGILQSVTLGASHPVTLQTKQQLITSASLEWTDSTERENRTALSKDKFRLIRLSGNYRNTFGQRNSSKAFFELTQGVAAFDASKTPGQLTSRSDADGQFIKMFAQGSVKKYFSNRLSITAAAKMQYTKDPLLYLEEFSFGGGAFGRAYDFGEILGDKGIAAYIEASLHGKTGGSVKDWQIYLFGDAGAVWNNGDGLSVDGHPLYSAGIGTRLFIRDKLFVGYEAAHPLSDAPFTLDDRHTRHRFHVTATN